MSSILTQSSRVVPDACSSTGNTGRWEEAQMNCWSSRLVGEGRRGQGVEKMLGAPSWARGTGESLLPGTTLLWLHGEEGGTNLSQRLAGSVPRLRHCSALERHLRPQHLPLQSMP